uniref:Uncharacterized protein n=1 Tax=Anguilla anguilla TaxID=7936 RepID=A0A0E9XW93_ANGAN
MLFLQHIQKTIVCFRRSNNYFFFLMRNIYQVHLVFSIFPCHENDCAAHFWGFITKHIDTVCCFEMPLKYLKME